MLTHDEIFSIEALVDVCSRSHGGFRHGEYVGFCLNCRAALAALRAPEGGTVEEAYGYLSRVINAIAPECTPLSTLMGVCTQVDHMLATAHVWATPPTPPPADLVAMVREWQEAVIEWNDAETNSTGRRLGKAEHALQDWTPAAPVPAQAGEPTPVDRIKRSIASVEELCSTCCTAAWCELAERCLAECLPEDVDAPLRRQSTSGYALAAPPVAQEPGIFMNLLDTATLVPVTTPNAFAVRFSLQGFGFGVFEFRLQPDGSCLIDDECTNRDTIKRVLGLLVDSATLWSERDDAQPAEAAPAPQKPPTPHPHDWCNGQGIECDGCPACAPQEPPIPRRWRELMEGDVLTAIQEPPTIAPSDFCIMDDGSYVNGYDAMRRPEQVVKITHNGVVIWHRPTPGDTP